MSEMQATNEYYQTENNYPQLSNKQQLILNSNNNIQITQNFFKIDIKEIGSTTQDINETIFEEDLSIIIDKLVNLYLEETNKGREEKVRKQFVLDYINN